ncbi:MAG: site-specific DNA-methyltransferase [Chitinophagaceae bacterium]|nr:site-specific DNA-methyltransferase [Chitinophagaceae bacterium]
MKDIPINSNGEEKPEVVLTWPMKEEQQLKQQPEFTRKAFTGFEFHTSTGFESVMDFSKDDNLIIKGDNLPVLQSLIGIYQGKVKLIYIDPPYNTGKTAFNYHDAFEHAAWLHFMRSRLLIARDFLTEDGTLWINIDDKESHYLKVLCDEIFGRENFVINFIWQKKYSPANDAKWFSDTHDHILVFARNKLAFSPHLLPRSAAMDRRYANLDDDPRGPWKPGGFSVKTYSKEYDYPIKTPSGKIVHPPKGSCWQTAEENYMKRLADNRIWFGVKGSSKPQIKQFLSEVQQGMVARSIWTFDEVGHNQVSRREITKLFGELVFATPKPEKLLKRILSLSTNDHDLVMDFFLGSGTTAAVAHKMNRRYIGIDQLDYVRHVAAERLKKVIGGEQGGISEEVGWQGGGSFKYMQLLEKNNSYVDFPSDEPSSEGLSAIDASLNSEFYKLATVP